MATVAEVKKNQADKIKIPAPRTRNPERTHPRPSTTKTSRQDEAV